MWARIERFHSPERACAHGEQGVTAVEYALILALIALVIIASVRNVGISVNGVFQHVATLFGF